MDTRWATVLRGAISSSGQECSGDRRRARTRLASPVVTTFYGQPAHRGDSGVDFATRAAQSAPRFAAFCARAWYNNFTDRAAAVTSIATGPRIAQNLQISSFLGGRAASIGEGYAPRLRAHRFTASASPPVGPRHLGSLARWHMSASAVAWPGQPDASVRHLLACGRHRHSMSGERATNGG